MRTALACLLAAVESLVAADIPKTAPWHIEIVDQAGAGRFSSMKIDRDGNLHVAYVADTSQALKYGFWDHQIKRWFTMTVAPNAGACSLALDSRQRPHLSYADAGSASGSRLWHAYWDGSSWNRDAVPLNSEIIAYYNSIVIDAGDRPNISFYEYRGPRGSDLKIRLRTVMWNGEYWEARTVDSQEGSGKFNAMTIDPQGQIHLAYANVTEGSLRYARWDGSQWKAEMVDGPPQNRNYVGYSTAVALDKEGGVHIAYMDSSSSQVKYAVQRNGRWENEIVAPVAGVGYPDRNSIAIDEDGRPFISYFDARQGTLNLAFRFGQRWYASVIDGNNAGFTSSLQLDRDTIWVSYADVANGGLKVARADLRDIVQAAVESAASEAGQ